MNSSFKISFPYPPFVLSELSPILELCPFAKKQQHETILIAGYLKQEGCSISCKTVEEYDILQFTYLYAKWLKIG